MKPEHRERALRLIHHWRPFLVRNHVYTRVTPPGAFRDTLQATVELASQFHDAVVLVNIAPAHPNIYERSVELPASISLYNRLIAQVVADSLAPKPLFVDVHSPIAKSREMMDECINGIDGHHLTRAGHRLYADLIMEVLRPTILHNDQDGGGMVNTANQPSARHDRRDFRSVVRIGPPDRGTR
jgi:hypothetical protein